MRVLLTGGTGYVGRYVAEACLERGWTVDLLTRSSSIIPASLIGKVVRHDYEVGYGNLYAIVQRAEPDCVVHMAATTTDSHNAEQTTQLINTNIIFPTLLLEAILKAGRPHFVNTGTYWQHYSSAEYCPVDMYAASKQSFQDILYHYTQNRGVRGITLKLFDNYGADDPRRKIFTLLIEAARRGEELALSGGEQILDLTHVLDVAQAFLRAIELVVLEPNESGATYFVSGERLSLKSLATIVAAKSRSNFRPQFGQLLYRKREIMTPIDPGCNRLPGWTARKSVTTQIVESLSG